MNPQQPLLTGWKAIAKWLHVGSEHTAISYARQQVDPLPVVVVRGTPCAIPRYVAEWSARRYNGGVLPDGTPLERLRGLRAVAKTLGVTIWAVMRLAHRDTDPLPLQSAPDGRRWAYRCAVRDWIDRQTMPFAVHDRLQSATRGAVPEV